MSGRKEIGMRVSGKMENFTEKELKHYLMALYSMVSGPKESLKEWECASTQMEQNTLEIGLMDNRMVMESRY